MVLLNAADDVDKEVWNDRKEVSSVISSIYTALLTIRSSGSRLWQSTPRESAVNPSSADLLKYKVIRMQGRFTRGIGLISQPRTCIPLPVFPFPFVLGEFEIFYGSSC